MCDSVVALGVETRRGHTLFAKNSDREGEECQPFVQHPAAHHAPGSTLLCTHIEIPQVAETYAVMGHSPWWVWGLEHGVNEHGVAIGNHTVFSREPVEETSGLIGMDLVRLGLERGRTAREALEVIATLLETHGQGGAARGPDGTGYHNSFLLADPGNAWQLETSNRRWVARQLRLGAVSNHYGLGNGWDIASRDFEAWVRQEGYWREPSRVDVANALRNPHVPGRLSSGRHRRSLEQLETGRGSHDVASFSRLLRDHDEGGPVWRGRDANPEEERFFTLCAHSDPVFHTTASLVAELPTQRPFAWPVWIGFGSPCTSVLVPVYLDATLPGCFARSIDMPDAPALWPRFKRLELLAARDPERSTPLARAAWQRFEASVDEPREDMEREARAAHLAGQTDRGRAILDDFVDRMTADLLGELVSVTDALGTEAPEMVASP
ncbi:MAG: C69 family dipeptidase [Myxococcota bacterium]